MERINMRICDICIDKDNCVIEAVTYCKRCGRDICENCIRCEDGYRICKECYKEENKHEVR